MFSRYLLLVQYKFSVFSMNLLISLSQESPVFHLGVQRYALFFNLQTFFQKSSNFYFGVSLSKNSWPLAATRFSNGSAKVAYFSLLPNFFTRNFAKFYTLYLHNAHKALRLKIIQDNLKIPSHTSLYKQEGMAIRPSLQQYNI